MCVADTYLSIREASRGLYKDLGSRFMAFAYPVETVGEAMAIVDSLKKEYHDARHCCYAYRLGLDGSVWRANDDGEPSGSAARPILGQIDSAGLSDVLVVVVRYFGGVKLGIPGLVKAYRTSSAEALQSAVKVEKTACRKFSLEFGYDALPSVMDVVKDLGLEQLSRDFLETCALQLKVPLSKVEIFFERIEKLSNFKEIN